MYNTLDLVTNPSDFMDSMQGLVTNPPGFVDSMQGLVTNPLGFVDSMQGLVTNPPGFVDSMQGLVNNTADLVYSAPAFNFYGIQIMTSYIYKGDPAKELPCPRDALCTMLETRSRYDQMLLENINLMHRNGEHRLSCDVTVQIMFVVGH